MMNQTKKHTTGKKLLALLLALIMTVSLLPMSVFAAEPGAEETPVVEGQTQPAAETGEDDAEQAQEPDADEADEGEEDAVLPGDAEGDADDADVADDGIAAFAADGVAVQASTVDYRILHLDCGRKYFTKDWIIALLNEMSAAGYNQLELAFGNKGLRFLLDEKDASGNDITVGDYTMAKVNEAIRAGNQAYDTSVSYAPDGVEELTQTDMDAIIAHAEKLNIAIVPMFNTPYHMEAVITAMESDTLDIANAHYGTESACLNLSNETAVSFVKDLMQKYVDYFKGKCSFFSFGADEYKGGWNDTFYTYANSIAAMINTAGMSARVFNDSFRGNEDNASLIGGTINSNYLNGVCYWYTGWDGNLYASVKSLANAGYNVINTNKDFYYVLHNNTAAEYKFSGNYDQDSWINYAKTFSNTTYNNYNKKGQNGSYSGTPIGSMFCVWCDQPGYRTETQVAQEIRMILRVMAARMKGTYDYSTDLVEGGFNANGTINGGSGGGTGPVDPNPGGTTETVDITLKVGETKSIPYKTADYPVWGKYEIDTTAAGYDNTIANVTVSYEPKDKTPVKAESITSGKSYYIMDDTGKVFLTTENGSVTATTDVNKATKWKITAITDSYNNITGYKIQAQVTGTYANYYLTGEFGSGPSLTKNFVVTTVKQSSNWFCSTNTEGIYKGLYYQLKSTTIGEAYGGLRYVTYDSTGSKWTTNWASSNVAFYETTADQTTINFKGLKAGTTAVKVGDVTYNITVKPVVNVELKVGQTSEGYEGAADATITKPGDASIATANVEPVNVPGKTTRTLGSVLTTSKNGSYEGVIAYKGTGENHYMKLSVVSGKADITDTTEIDEATVFTFNKTYSGCTIQAKDSSYYVAMQSSYGYTYTLTAQSGSYTWSVGGGNDFYYKYWNTEYYISYSNNDWELVSDWTSAGKGYSFTETTTTDKTATNITFTGVKPGETTYVIGGVTYHITVEAKTVNVTLEVGDSTTFNVGSSKISKFPDSNIAKAAWNDGVLTLAGMTVGNTECIVGDTKYVITVVAKGSTTGGSPFYVDLWVTNHGVLPDTSANYTVVNGGESTDTGARRVTLQYEANKFASSKGLSVSEFLPSTGSDTADSTRVAAYWKTRYLPQSTRQTTAGWTNKSGYGTDVLSGKAGGLDIERVRYYGGTWAYLPVGGTDWVDFTTAATAANKAAVTKDETGAQIAAYYLLKTEVTKEVTTYITDWPDPHDTGSTAIYGVALDYCVKYLGDNVTRYPSEFGNDNENTHWFNCDGTIGGLADQNGYTVDANVANAAGWTGRRTNATTSQKNSYDDCYRVINNIEAIDTAEYEVYMITTTPSDSFALKGYTQCPDTITYPTTREEVIWAIDDQAVTDSGLAKHAELVVGGTPRVNRVMIQQCSGLLLTYYVRAKSNVENLHVNYYDQDTGLLIHSYDIIPHETQTPNNFAGFQWDNANLNAGFATGTDYVYNNEGKKVTVQTDLTKVSGIAGKYQVGFALVEINKTDDNKTLNLYYKLDNSRTYVVDFGVPANVERWSDLSFTKVTAGKTDLFADGKTTDAVAKATNGKLYVDSDKELYYQLTTMEYTAPDVFNVTYTYADNTSNTYTVTFIPASNVYYEDDDAFITFAGGQGKADAAQWKVELDKGKTADESKQIAEVLSKAENVYGTDPTYANSTKFSLGRAHKVTVSADMVNNWNENSDAWPTAQFTFKGTGFDVISLTDNKSGLLICKVVDVAKGEVKYNKFVNDYYGYGYVKGEWIKVDKDAANALYQLPVVKVDGLPYSEYTVTLTVGYSALFDNADRGSYSFWLDGVRIYDPAGKTLDETYAKDHEGWPKYIELHDELVKTTDATVKHSLLFIEGNEQAALANYTSYGPNHEVYLLPGQTIAFKLDDVSNVDKVQIGAKAPMGSAVLKVNNGEAKPIATATDMYYDITEYAISGEGMNKTAQTVTITNGGTDGTILSLTQLKVTHKTDGTQASLAILNENEQKQVVQMVRAMYAPVEPEVFTPERFEASWNRSTVKVGQKATLTVKTSTDVDAITVDGVTVTNYRTRTQRTGWGWNATKVTYREFTYTITAAEAGTLDYSVVAVNADGVSSEPISAMLTVQAVQRPQRPSWLDKIFSRWF